jgi:quinohemoprotein ethanol dehydrogenase
LKTAAKLGACGLLLLAACRPAAHDASADKGAAAAKNGVGANWTSRNADAAEDAYSPLTQIDSSNIGRLGLAWSLDLPGEATLEATPVAVDGVLYFTGSYATVYAVDGASGKLLWTYAPETWKHNPEKMHYGFAANRGVAYDNGKIFSAASDGRLFALDAKTGKLLWSVETTDPKAPQTVTGAPRTFKGKVIIGQGGADFGQRGYVTAYDQATGQQAWRFYVVPATDKTKNASDPAMEKAAATWQGSAWKSGIGGGGPWDSLTFDPELNRIYVGTANAAPYDPSTREGDNLYTASIVALDADTGKYVWHYQLNPRDSWDYDSTQQMTLATLTIDGKPRKVVMQAPKNGFFYVIDRETGKLISAQKLGKATWASTIDIATGRPVEEKNIRYETGDLTVWPSSAGAHSWMSQSFSPKTGLVYIPYMQLGVHYAKGKEIPGGVYVSGLGIKDVEGSDALDGKGALIAWDPVQQKAAWTAPLETLWNGGAMATAGNVVFQGAADGYLYAYDAAKGQRLWRYDGRMGIIAAPMSYSAGGKQYVSVLVGYGGSAAIWGDPMNVGWKYRAPRRLLTFALDGKATLPPTPGPDKTIHPVDNPALKINPADVKAGHDLFLACAVCHGRNLVGTGGPAPDLRESQIALDPDSFWNVVHDGALLQNGMPQFQQLTRPQVMQLYAYIRDGARQAIAAQKTASVGTPAK